MDQARVHLIGVKGTWSLTLPSTSPPYKRPVNVERRAVLGSTLVVRDGPLDDPLDGPDGPDGTLDVNQGGSLE